MKFYMAPMEGITGYIFRNSYQTCFGGMEKYFSPFLAAHSQREFHPRELQDVLPEHNRGIPLIPQILTNRADDFLLAVRKMQDLGYQEVNLNLGCPSKTVVSKGRGAGFLEDPLVLDRFFDAIFEKTEIKISVKTRLGMEFPSEFEDLLAVYNKYPIEELIVHPRLQCDYYNGSPRKEYYEYALHHSRIPVCYNGDICTAEDYRALRAAYPQTKIIMMGRGILQNPFLPLEIRGMRRPDKEKLRQFHDLIFTGYQDVMSGERPVLFKMKELWQYMICLFADAEKYAKKIRKTQRLSDYIAIVDELFQKLTLKQLISPTGGQ
ncbi:MAG: tRNA dihydrouridine synthase [Lachnospiraceae bacterium]|jgi:tRNA-dihydrouridine synthase